VVSLEEAKSLLAQRGVSDLFEGVFFSVSCWSTNTPSHIK
jgi:hypothetical protein